MSKEKIIGLSVIGVLAATLAGVTAWRMLGGKAAPSSTDAAAVATDTVNLAAAPKSGSSEPTVLASASSTSNDSLADRLSGKTKIKGGWETAAPAGSATDAPTLPGGASAASPSEALHYSAGAAASGVATEADQGPNPSYMPRETAGDSSARYGVESADPSYATDATSAGETTVEVPEQLSPGIEGAASDPAQDNGAGLGSYPAPAAEAMQIVEREPAPLAAMPETVPVDPVAELATRRAEHDAHFAQAMAKEAEAVQIADSALQPMPTSAYEANDPAAADENTSPSSSSEELAPQRFTEDARFTAASRYASEAAVETVDEEPQTILPTEATTPAAQSNVPVNSAASPAGNAAVVESYPAAAEPSYRDSVYREPAKVPTNTVGTVPAPANASMPASSAVDTTVPARAPYRSETSTATAPFGNDVRTRPVAMGNAAPQVAAAERHVPQRENTGKYYVEPGDSFWIISKKVYGNGGFFKALQEHNRARVLNPAELQVGDEIITPSVAELREQYSGLCPKQRIAKPGSPAAMQAGHLPVSHSASVRQYEVQNGDTLFDIARYELGDASRWPEIYQLNRVALGDDIDYVKPGTKLVLPADAPIEASPEEDGYRGDVLTRQPTGSGLR